MKMTTCSTSWRVPVAAKSGAMTDAPSNKSVAIQDLEVALREKRRRAGRAPMLMQGIINHLHSTLRPARQPLVSVADSAGTITSG